jgi:hypothetical protein
VQLERRLSRLVGLNRRIDDRFPFLSHCLTQYLPGCRFSNPASHVGFEAVITVQYQYSATTNYHTIDTTQMSASNQTTDPSISNFTAIFDAASHEYKTLTKQDLATHPFAATLQDYNSPDSILNVFRDQAQAFAKVCNGDDKLMEWLTPIVNVLFAFSESLGEGVSLVSPLSFYMSRCYTTVSVGIFACKDDFRRNRCPSRGTPPPHVPPARVTCNA